MAESMSDIDEQHLVPDINLTATGNDYYNYDPLPAEGWIRVLQLHPGSVPDPLRCSLLVTSIEDGAPSGFEALSYVWGDNALENKTEVQCDGQVLSIGSNLACALTYIRHETETRSMWVDAVCINQQDKDERSSQVRRMGEIYASAERVVIWMGEDHRGEAEECFVLIQTTNTTLTKLLEQYKEVDKIPVIPLGSGTLCDDSRKWDMVRRLRDLEWFRRVWVLQEVGLARSALILWGNASMNWSDFVEFMLYVAARADVQSHTGNVRSGPIWDVFEDLWRSFGNSVSWRNELPFTRSLNHAGGNPRFIDMLNDARPYEATDQRDRVYAFLSHPRADLHTMVVDYNKNVDEVYVDTARRILDTDPHPWTVLSCVDHAPDSPSATGGRLSWVPRWDEDWRVYWLGYPGMWYRAGGSESASFQVSISPQNSALEMHGILLDTIEWTSQAFISEELSLAKQQEEPTLQKLWHQLEQRQVTALYGTSREDREYAYSLAVVAGRAADEGPAEDNPNLQQSVYQAYKDLICRSNTNSLLEGSNDPGDHQTSVEIDAITYVANQRRALHNRRFFLTSKGYYGVGHRALQAGDMCWVFRGANVPFILRAVALEEQTDPLSNQYTLVSECYIQGIMKGEVLGMPTGNNATGSGNVIEQEIIII